MHFVERRVGRALAASKVEKYFPWTATETELSWQPNPEHIQRDAAVEGIYVLRTNVASEQLDHEQTVLAYKRLATVERASRCLKSVDLKVRPLHHRLPERVRARVFLAMLAYYVEWHMRQALAPVLFDDEEHGAPRSSAVAPSHPLSVPQKAKPKRSASARKKTGRCRVFQIG